MLLDQNKQWCHLSSVFASFFISENWSVATAHKQMHHLTSSVWMTSSVRMTSWPTTSRHPYEWHHDIPLHVISVNDVMTYHFTSSVWMTSRPTTSRHRYEWHHDLPLHVIGTNDVMTYHFTSSVWMTSWPATWRHHTIRYDSVCLTCSKKLTGSQLSLPHGTNKKLKCKTKNKMMTAERDTSGPVPLSWGSPVGKRNLGWKGFVER